MAQIDATQTPHSSRRPLREIRWLSSAVHALVFLFTLSVCLFGCAAAASAGEADLAIPDLHQGKFHIFGTEITAWNLLAGGALVICGTLGISLYQFFQIKKQPAHQSMLNVA